MNLDVYPPLQEKLAFGWLPEWLVLNGTPGEAAVCGTKGTKATLFPVARPEQQSLPPPPGKGSLR